MRVSRVGLPWTGAVSDDPSSVRVSRFAYTAVVFGISASRLRSPNQ
ncbi:hypothetical protein [Actinokineospora sp.]